jgi:hyperosmotically inducible protein
MKKNLLLPVLCLVALSGCGNSTDSYGNSNRMGSNSAQMTDSEISTKVKASINGSQDSLSDSARSVSVSTTNGVVTLKGTVANREESRKLEKIARSVSGVKNVNNQLEISNY